MPLGLSLLAALARMGHGYGSYYQAPRQGTPEIDAKLEAAKAQGDLDRIAKAEAKRQRKATRKA